MLTRKQWMMILGVGALATVTYGIISNQGKNTSYIGAESTGKTIWKLFKPQNDRFEVLLPSIPQHVSEKHPTGTEFTKYDVYLSQDREGSVYMISLTEYPESYEMGSPEEVLEAVKNGALGSNSKNELKSAESSTYLNMPSMDFAIESSESAIRSKVIVNEKTLVVLTAMNRNPAHLDADFATFAGSFVLKPTLSGE